MSLLTYIHLASYWESQKPFRWLQSQPLQSTTNRPHFCHIKLKQDAPFDYLLTSLASFSSLFLPPLILFCAIKPSPIIKEVIHRI